MAARLLGIMLLLMARPGPIYGQETEVEMFGPSPLAQVKPQERGNCFQWPNCRGDSIGAMWVADPDICKALGGKSWMAPDRKCYNLPGGPHNIQGP